MTGTKFGCSALLVSVVTAILSYPSTGQPRSGDADRVLDQEIEYQVLVLTSNEKSFQVELYLPRSAGLHPLAVFVPGALGVRSCDHKRHVAPEKDNFGEKTFAGRGFVVAVVHYMDVSDIASTTDRQIMVREAPSWINAIATTVSSVRKMKIVDPDKVFLFGESLGGLLSLVEASQDRSVRAVSVFATGVPETPLFTPERLPPVLIQNGELDSVFPNQAKELCELLTSKKVRCKAVFYAGVGHYFSQDALRQVTERTITYFIPESAP